MPRTNPWWKGMGKREGVILTRRRRDAEISAEKRRSQQRGRARRQRRMGAFGSKRTRFPREDQKQSRWGAMDSLHRLGYTRRKLQLCKRIGVAMVGGGIVYGLVAAWVPARRGARGDPMEAVPRGWRGGRRGWIRWRHSGGSKGGGRRMPPRMGSWQPKRLRYRKAAAAASSSPCWIH